MQRSVLSRLLAVVIAFATCSCFAAVGGEDGATTDKPVKPKAPLTFRVTGRSQASPDGVTLHFAIVGDGDTLSEAQQQLQKTEKSISTTLQTQGVKPADIMLERFAAVPLQAGSLSSSSSAAKPLGYRVNRQYAVSIPVTGDSLDRVLKVADSVLAQGARPVVLESSGYDGYDGRQTSLMEFTIKDPEKLTQQAMNDALKRARNMAEQAASAMGYGPGVVKLVAVHSYNAGTGYDHYDSPGNRIPMTTSSWQPVKAAVCIEAEFEVKPGQ